MTGLAGVWTSAPGRIPAGPAGAPDDGIDERATDRPGITTGDPTRPPAAAGRAPTARTVVPAVAWWTPGAGRIGVAGDQANGFEADPTPTTTAAATAARTRSVGPQPPSTLWTTWTIR